MQVILAATNLTLTEGLRSHIQARLDAALDRFQPRLHHVRVRLSDINGPHGGVDKRCQLELSPHALPKIIMEDIADDLYVAIDRAISRLKTVVHRKLARSH